MSNQQVWFITGCSSGLGRILATETLKSGASVAVTARNIADISHFANDFPDQVLLLQVDVTNMQQINDAVMAAKKKFGRIDVLVNNAGVFIFGAVEEVPDENVRNLFDVNFFGVLNTTRAVLPIMREQQAGHIINISAAGGLVATQCLGIFNASKFAVEGLSEALADELAPLGIKVTLIEPGPIRTPLLVHSSQTFNTIAEYNDTRAVISQIVEQYKGNQPGDPQKIAEAIIEIANMPVPPLRLLLGKFTIDRTREKILNLSKTISEWEAYSSATDFKNQNS
jgi:NAD(P)-dependent dehydrogenase (short-subunit alcohol dehydrogenase family)